MERQKPILTDTDLADRWGCSPGVLTGHRRKGLKAFRVAHKASASATGASLWRYRLADVEAYERKLVEDVEAERLASLPQPPAQAALRPSGATPSPGDRLGTFRPRPPKRSQ